MLADYVRIGILWGDIMRKVKGKRQVSVMVLDDVYSRLKAEAETEGVSIAEIVRAIIYKHQSDQGAKIGAYVVEDAVQRVTGPQIDRLASLIAHTAIASGTSAWLVRALLNLTTDVNTENAWDQAVAEARAGLRRVFSQEVNTDAE